jgi:hypothetical protein
MKPESRRIIHMGINYVIVPVPEINKEAGLKFQQSLISEGIEFTDFTLEEKQIFIQRKPPFPLQARVSRQISPPQPFGQVLVIAPNPNRSLETFAWEAQAVLSAFGQTWPSTHRQILSCDVALRCLYQSTSAHAFKELWEERLHQPKELLDKLDRKVLGGGLRFVMPTQESDPEPTQVEVKIESFLKDTGQIFVETQFFWPEPKPPGSPFQPDERLKQVNEYILNQVHAFLEGGS